MVDRTPRKLSLRKRFAFSVVTLLLSYAIAEAACTAFLPISPGATGSNTFAVIENKGGVCFDPILGYRISKTPARFTRVIKGAVEFIGCFRGNAQGFQGAKDFTIQKPPGIKWRTIVLGDSFTSAAFLNASWTSRVEEKRPDCELVNCAVDGTGLANWWSILTRYLLPQKYECDEIVIASIENDLVRRFVAGQSNSAGIMLGYFSWDPPSYPCSLAEASPNAFRLTYSQLKSYEFDNSLREGRLCYGPNPHKVTRPWIAARLGRLAADHLWREPVSLTPCEPRKRRKAPPHSRRPPQPTSSTPTRWPSSSTCETTSRAGNCRSP